MAIGCFLINLLSNKKTINTFKRWADNKLKLNFILFNKTIHCKSEFIVVSLS